MREQNLLPGGLPATYNHRWHKSSPNQIPFPHDNILCSCCLFCRGTFNCMMPAGVLAFGAATVAVLRKLRRPAHQNVHSVKFIPYSGEPASLVDCIVVDCTHPDAQTFTHHKNDNNPKVQPADCSTGIVLNALGVSSPSPELKTALEKPNVSVNHFDADALIAMWCLINREAARNHDKRALCCRTVTILSSDQGWFLDFLHPPLCRQGCSLGRVAVVTRQTSQLMITRTYQDCSSS